jgi:hypothetical protein
MRNVFNALSLLRMLALGAVSIPAVFAGTFDAETQFSLTTNTASNTWSYWGSSSTTVSTYPSTIALLPVLFDKTCGFGTSCWDATTIIGNLILQNATGSDVTAFPNSDARNDQLTFYPRTGLVLVRFLVPTTGTYDLTGFFEGSASTPQFSQDFIDIDENVGSPLLNSSGGLAFGAVNSFDFTNLSLNAGNTVDFLVAGTSTDGNNSLSTGFDATFTQVTSVPEAGGFVLLAGGLLVLGAVKKYKRVGRTAV